MTVAVRFAPSPTGKLHVGNVRAALWNWLFARRHGGRFTLRIDDTDRERSTAAFEDGIRRDLDWLGLGWDETFRQSDRFDRYEAAAAALIGAGRLYPCYETPEELERRRRLQRARGLPPVYDRAALQLTDADRAALEAEGRRPHWRFRLSREPVGWTDLIRGETVVDTSAVSDPVLRRADGVWLYTLPSVVDDLDTGVTHVIRGEDHVTNTAVQIEIMQALTALEGRGAAPAFAHHSLLVGTDGSGLSKRLGALSVEALRAAGIEAPAIASLLARLGTARPVESVRDLEALAATFDLADAGRAPARFDEADLRTLSARVLHETPYADVAARLAPLGVEAPLWNAVRGNLERLEDAAEWKRIVEGPIDPPPDETGIAAAAAALVPDGPLTEESWGPFVEAVKARTGARGRALFMPLRKALTGRETGPEMAPLFALIGSEAARVRLGGGLR